MVDLGVRRHVGSWRYQMWVLRQVRFVLARFPDAALVLTEGDKVLPFLWLLPHQYRRRLTVLVMRVPARGGGRRSRWLFQRLKRLALTVSSRTCRVLVLAPAMTPSSGYVWRGRAAVPDPVEVTPAAPSSLTFLTPPQGGGGAMWLGVFGAISRRKNVVEVVDAMVRAAGPNDAALLLAGQVSIDYADEVMHAIRRARSRGYTVVLENRFLSNSELDGAIQMVDIVVAAYSNDASSGIFGKAVALGTLVVAAETETLVEATRSLGDRVMHTGLTPEALTDALREAIGIAMSRERRPLELAGPEEFVSALLS
ncbi:hypothetical protein [Georgenia halophila]